MDVYLGVDWARYNGVVVALVGEREHRFKYDRTSAGIEQLMSRVRGVGGANSSIRVAIEAGDTAVTVLLSRWGAIVHVIDPKQAKRHAESLRSTRAKDDVRDARNLARMAQSEAHRREPFVLPDDRREALDLVMSELERSGERQQRLVNQLRARLVEIAPELDNALGDVTTKRALALIEMAPIASLGQAVDDATWQNFCRTYRVHMKDRGRLLEAIRAPWRDLPPAVEKVTIKQIRLLVQELRAATASRDAADDMLEELLRDEPHAGRLQTIKGIGTTLAATLTVLGATEAKDRNELATLVGVAPVTIQSGNTKLVSRRHEVSTTVNRAAFLVGLMAARWLTWGKAMYADGRARGQTHAHAVRRVGRSLMRIIHAMINKQTDYDETKYIASLKARGVKWAHDLGSAPNASTSA